VSTPLTLRTGHRPDGRPVVTAQGEIDMTNLDRFRAALAEAVADHPELFLDLTEVTYLDSGAINVMFSHAGHLHLTCNQLLLRALTISGLTRVARVEARDIEP
jgi:anti-anti-sigma factor